MRLIGFFTLRKKSKDLKARKVKKGESAHEPKAQTAGALINTLSTQPYCCKIKHHSPNKGMRYYKGLRKKKVKNSHKMVKIESLTSPQDYRCSSRREQSEIFVVN